MEEREKRQFFKENDVNVYTVHTRRSDGCLIIQTTPKT